MSGCVVVKSCVIQFEGDVRLCFIHVWGIPCFLGCRSWGSSAGVCWVLMIGSPFFLGVLLGMEVQHFLRFHPSWHLLLLPCQSSFCFDGCASKFVKCLFRCLLFVFLVRFVHVLLGGLLVWSGCGGGSVFVHPSLPISFFFLNPSFVRYSVHFRSSFLFLVPLFDRVWVGLELHGSQVDLILQVFFPLGSNGGLLVGFGVGLVGHC